MKTVRTADASAARALIREARVMGSLEHPNLVPVHAVGIDSAGEPILVMKRIEGVSWRQLLAEAAHPAWTPLLAGHGDLLRAHVEILTQLCRALAFAHEHGVVHRDLKPENVMVGRHGEVYLFAFPSARSRPRESSERRAISLPRWSRAIRASSTCARTSTCSAGCSTRC